MTTALATVPPVTSEQLELVKKTVANGATSDELKLYLYDCARQGVHPLDKLIHFTKRSGKYTPVTSIDFMRIRAAETGEYAGSDDAVFGSQQQAWPESATVTVWRLVQGQRCSFTATARWTEYKPDQDFMWKKMPHTMLGKCAEALALRKGFPKQLSGLYAKEEMDQAGPMPSVAVGVVEQEPEPKPEKPAPAGFESWCVDMNAVADEGITALEKAWKASSADLKRYLVSTDPEAWESLKDRARKREQVPA